MIFYNDRNNCDKLIGQFYDTWDKQPHKVVRPPNFYKDCPNRDRYISKNRNFDAYCSQDWNANHAAWQVVNMR
jgi:hypothetical protein